VLRGDTKVGISSFRFPPVHNASLSRLKVWGIVAVAMLASGLVDRVAGNC
jgi:hypothetical protein